ncbi:MAG: M3 family metallopeptidase [Paludibacteraceae bacterium]|nr:M3 family metallopeptidase [Paludibacteraceae bacterium]MBQ6984928.1 M3 family metallopeptidase [Paludibacteraceae bacterium]
MKKSILTMALAGTVLAASAATNPFFDYKNWKTPHGTYPFNEIHAEHYMPAFEEAFKQGLKEIDDIVNNPAAPTFKNTIEAYEASGEMLGIVAGCFYNLTSAETNDSLQQIEMELSPKMSEYASTIRLNEGLFKRIKAVYDQRDKLKLNKAQMKLLEDIYESFANNGANLSPEDKQVYRELTAKLSQLTLQFGQNVLKATNAWTMLLTDESLLAGLNEDTKGMLRANAEKKGLDGWLLNLKPTTTIPVMKDLDNRDIRRELYMANVGKCIGGEFDNTGIIVEIVNTRLALAKLFDKKTYADKSLYKTMAETPENVYKLLDELRDAYMPTALEEVKEVEDYAHAHGFYAAHLQPWDFSYYSKKLKQEKFSISDDDLRPYFELESVKKGVFGLAERLYGLKFKENKNIQVYNPEVTAYEVFDEKGKFLAVYYADFHPRDGKRGGAWMNDFQPQFIKGKKDHRPHIVNVMNFTRPTAEKPALFTYDEVRTFLHEFGHALHGMLTRCQYSAQSGTNVPRDFVELPSQFNENFIDEKEFLDTFAKHYKTGEALPQELLDKMHASQTFHAAYACARQLSFGYLDMAWHSLEKPFEVNESIGTIESVVRFSDEAMEQVKVLPNVPGTQMATAFTHIFSGGYAAGYYSYKWSELLDADAFSVFKEAKKTSGTIFDKKAAKRFRENILEKGGTEKPMDLYKRFRGGEPTINALLERDGIKAQEIK